MFLNFRGTILSRRHVFPHLLTFLAILCQIAFLEVMSFHINSLSQSHSISKSGFWIPSRSHVFGNKKFDIQILNFFRNFTIWHTNIIKFVRSNSQQNDENFYPISFKGGGLAPQYFGMASTFKQVKRLNWTLLNFTIYKKGNFWAKSRLKVLTVPPWGGVG